jgi:hypothetical protein
MVLSEKSITAELKGLISNNISSLKRSLAVWLEPLLIIARSRVRAYAILMSPNNTKPVCDWLKLREEMIFQII